MISTDDFERTILKIKLDLKIIEEGLQSLTGLNDLKNHLEVGVSEFEASTGELLDLFESGFTQAENLCPCGSNLPYDRHDFYEEPACGQCCPGEVEAADNEKQWETNI